MVVGEQGGMDRVTTNFRSGSSITSVKVISCPRAQCECDARCCHCVPMCERRLFTALGRLLGEGTALVSCTVGDVTGSRFLSRAANILNRPFLRHGGLQDSR
jgi:hypothetical protein